MATGAGVGETGVWLPLEEGMTEFMNGSNSTLMCNDSDQSGAGTG